ncbi:MAG: type IV pilus secretin PilQ [Nitrospirota bacterium]|nr:MAG: type IV pilus secretin PilQ [Nitrospirota bacterium]
MNRKQLSLLIFNIFIALLIAGCASAPPADVTSQASTDEAVIESIEVFDNQIRIQLSAPSEYIVYKPGDPFKVIVGLPGVNPGNFQEKILSDRRGISEINPVLITEPSISTKLEILLQNPAKLVPEMNDNLLVLMVAEDDTIQIDEAEIADIEEPMTEEIVATDEPVGMEEIEVIEEAGVSEEIVDEPVIEEAIIEEQIIEDVAMDEPAPAMGSGAVITDISFESVKDAVKVIIEADQDIKPNVLPLEGKLVLDFAGVEMKASVPDEVAYPLEGMRWGKHNGKTRIVLDLMRKANYDVIAINKRVVVSLSAPDMFVKVDKGEAGPPGEAPKDVDVEVGAEETLAAVLQKGDEQQELAIDQGRYVGKKISLDFQDADIIPIFRLFADVSGYNFVISPKVSGKITMKLINVPWDQALDLVLRTHNLGTQVDGNIVRIAPNKDLQKESEEQAKARAALTKAKPLTTKIFTINYVGVDRMSEAIKKAKLVSSRGSITLDERASVIIVNDVDDSFPKIQELIDKLDQPELQVRQVLIEARIVEATTTFARDLGVQWGTQYRDPSGRVTVGGTGQVGGPGFSGNNFLVNMPAGVSQGGGGAIGFGYLNSARTMSLDLQLSALERTGKGKIVSNPRIMTMNNTPAKISQGRSIFVQTATSDKADVKPIDAQLVLDVTPTIAPGGAILLKLKINKDEPGDIVAGNISINTSQAETTTLINSGDTVVIGGIYKKTVLTSDDGVPVLSKIPLFGALFKHKSRTEEVAELLIFITPRVVDYEMNRADKTL